jgi:hypothetical protein
MISKLMQCFLFQCLRFDNNKKKGLNIIKFNLSFRITKITSL